MKMFENLKNLHFFDSLLPVRVSDKNSTVGRICTPALATTDVPSIADHQLKVIIFINGGGDVAVIIFEFIRSDLMHKGGKAKIKIGKEYKKSSLTFPSLLESNDDKNSLPKNSNGKR